MSLIQTLESCYNFWANEGEQRTTQTSRTGRFRFSSGRKPKQFYESDFLCFDQIILELKAVKTVTDEHRAQVINYLKVTGKKLELIVNFGHYPGLEHERLLN